MQGAEGTIAAAGQEPGEDGFCCKQPLRGLDSFISHCIRADTSGRMLVIEPSLSHQETFPSLVHYGAACGVGVDFLLFAHQKEEREIIRAYSAREWENVNFFYALEPGTYAAAAHILNKYPYGYLYFNTLFDAWLGPPEVDYLFNTLTVAGKKAFATVHSRSDFLRPGHVSPLISRENVFVLGEQVAGELDLPLLSPTVFNRPPSSAPFTAETPIRFVVVGEFNPGRRSYQGLMDSCIALNDAGLAGRYTVHIVGGVAPDCEQAYAHYQANARRYGLAGNLLFASRTPFRELFILLQQSHCLLFLLTSRGGRFKGYLRERITGAQSLALGFGVVPLLEAPFAEAWGLATCSAVHDPDDLTGGMRRVIESPEDYAPARRCLAEKNAALVEAGTRALRRGMGLCD